MIHVIDPLIKDETIGVFAFRGKIIAFDLILIPFVN